MNTFFNMNTINVLSQIKLLCLILMVAIMVVLLLKDLLEKHKNNGENLEGMESGLGKKLSNKFKILVSVVPLKAYLDNLKITEGQKAQDNIIKDKEEMIKKLEGETNIKPVSDKTVAEIATQQSDKIHDNKNLDNSVSGLQQSIKDLNVEWGTMKSSILNLNINEMIKSLTTEQLGALSNLLFSNVILGSTISIVFIFYGDYLINKFKLEIRYPKLARIIQLRRTFQNYYLKLNISWILFCVLIQM